MLPRLILLLVALFPFTACTDRTVHRPLKELHNDVEVYTDDRGVAHIYGKNMHDAMFMQGYITARDRGFQIEWLKLQAAGRISELLGPGFREQDLFVRAMGFRRHADDWVKTAAQEDPVIWEVAESYTAGVNAFWADAKTGARGAKLSPLFAALGHVPTHAEPADILAADHLITFEATPGAAMELQLYLLGTFIDGEVFDDLFMISPAEKVSVIPGFIAGLAPAAKRAPYPKLKNVSPASARQWYESLTKLSSPTQRLTGGSNAWTVGKEFTQAGIPLLANDTHQGLGNPSVYYQIHIDAGEEYHAEGLSFAGGPGVMLGHNGYIAWGATTNQADNTDVWLESKKDGGTAVEFKGKTVPLTFRDEVWKFNNHHDIEVDCKPSDDHFCTKSGEQAITFGEVPHHGPVFPKELLPAEIRNALMFSMRWAGMDGGFKASGLRSIFRLSMAKTPAEAEEAFRDYTGGAFNFHYATISGHHGHHSRTAIPIRGCDERPYLVMTGSGKCEWTGFVPLDRIPHARDPERGFIVSANNDSGGQTFNGHPDQETEYIGAIYDSGFRAKRIDDRLTQLTRRGQVTREDMVDLQSDNYSGLARRLIPYFASAVKNRPDWFAGKPAEMKAAADAMLAWDLRATSDSPVVHLFHAWFARVAFTMFDDEIGEGFLGDMDSTFSQIVVRPLLHFLDETQPYVAEIEAGTRKFPSNSGHNYFDDKTTLDIETRDELMLNAFAWAFQQANTIAVDRGFSAKWDERPWSLWHRVNLGNDGDFAVPELKLLPIPTDGALWTVDVADFNLLRDGELRTDFDTGNTPSNRSLFELHPSGSRMWLSIPGGQSEHPGDEHFADWVIPFYKNETLKEKSYYAMPFNRSDVVAAARKQEIFPAGFEGGR